MSCEIGEGTELIMADPEAIHRIILNLLGNALDAVEPENGLVKLIVPAGTDPQRIELAVEDNGPGVPHEKVEEIFKPFVSSKGNRGTGLGLPVSRKLAREHGGDLTLETGPEGQTIFRLTIPRTGQDRPEATISP